MLAVELGPDGEVHGHPYTSQSGLDVGWDLRLLVCTKPVQSFVASKSCACSLVVTLAWNSRMYHWESSLCDELLVAVIVPVSLRRRRAFVLRVFFRAKPNKRRTKLSDRRQKASCGNGPRPQSYQNQATTGVGMSTSTILIVPEGATGTAHKRKRANNRRIAVPSSSDSDEDVENEKATATGAHPRQSNVTSTKSKTISTSPQPGSLKRRQSTSASGVPTAPSTAKRKRAESSPTATEDAARKYCLEKFTEMFTGIFMQYPHIQLESNPGIITRQ
ncbi:hypothetical protein F5148DRAFT_471984 [Russula earlei]|uniref:Uncharacterized protein n=1 Tax=Russula earlei TaxID=71964 RepID=A0ACC0UHA7_9AGAM|nr:hypothetical protein F5148DRAFT_471984 [Russula earlei]